MKHINIFKKNAPRSTLHAPHFKGFSFIEVMLSVFLISVGITTTLSLITLGIRKSTENRRQLIAVMLSQEGIELVRNIRDTDAKATSPDSFKHMPDGNYNYIIDYTHTADTDLSSGSEQLDYVDGFYKHEGGPASQFSRRIKIISNGETRTVFSTVVWGNDDIPDDPSERNCNLVSRCTFTKITLNKWRE